MRTTTLNYVLYQAGWLAAIGGAATGHEALGVTIAGVCLAAHLTLTREPVTEARLTLAALLVGILVESVHRASGTYQPQSTVLPTPLPALWLLVLWAQFATTFRYCLKGVLAVPWRAALFGGVGGPIGFWAASRLGALDITPPTVRGLAAIAITWTVALVALSTFVVRRHATAHPATYRLDRD